MPLIPQLTFDGAGYRRILPRRQLVKAWRLPLLEPSRLPPGPEVFALPLSEKPFARCPRSSVSGRLVFRVVNMTLSLGPPCADRSYELTAVLTRLRRTFVCALGRRLPLIAIKPRGCDSARREGCNMPRSFTARKQELITRGRNYQLIPAFPRLPGIIPESFILPPASCEAA